MQINKDTGMSILARLFQFSGRASRKEFWLYDLGIVVAMILCIAVGALFEKIHFILGFPFCLVFLALIVASVATSFRRLHDLGLSGFWVLYLLPIGLPAIVIAYLLGVDDSAKNVIDRIKGIGSPWLGWIIAWFAWPFGSCIGFLMVLLAPGLKGDNAYGPDPLAA